MDVNISYVNTRAPSAPLLAALDTALLSIPGRAGLLFEVAFVDLLDAPQSADRTHELTSLCADFPALQSEVSWYLQCEASLSPRGTLPIPIYQAEDFRPLAVREEQAV